MGVQDNYCLPREFLLYWHPRDAVGYPMTNTLLTSLLHEAVEAQRRFRSRWSPVTPDPAMDVAPDAIRATLTALSERLTDNYPFFHPDYAGQMLKPPHPVAMAAYMTAMQINPNNHALDGGPATAAMELETVRMLAQMFGYVEHLGHLTSSGTIANLEALWVARETHPSKGIAFSPAAHYTHARMCGVLRMEGRTVDVHDMEALETAFRTGTIGTLVVTIGTTATGTVEPLHRILPLAKKYGVRLHADCAYGGFFTLLAKAEPPLVEPGPFLALKECDSIVIDPHKHGLQPYGCGCVIFRDPAVGRFYKHDSPYTYFTSDALHLGEISLECSRAGASAAALWATLQCLPLQPDSGFGPILSATRNAALRWDASMETMPGWRRFVPPQLDIVTYFPVPDAHTASSVSERCRRLFTASMTLPDRPFYLALMTVDTAALTRLHPDIIPDTPQAQILRSVLMKPEHFDAVPDLLERMDTLSRSIR